MSRYDAIVIGGGAGGGIVAYTLAEAGARVLLLERGRHQNFETTARDHLRNHRLAQYGHNTGPDLVGNPRVFVGLDGIPEIVPPHHHAYSNNAMVEGGGTLVYGGQAWRFPPRDFKMASTYGVPEGSSLADWPISYEDLEPYYEWAEHAIGVSGSDPAPEMPDRRAYPMPALPQTPKGQILEEAAKRLGWGTQRVPLLINSVPRDDRAGCIHCQHCVGFACPVDAKNGTQNTVIPKAVATGRCEVKTEAMVLRVEHFRHRATGVVYSHGDEVHVADADKVYVCGGAVETARLLLNSGIGNGQVGRNLQAHYYSSTMAIMPEPVWNGVGPGASIATLKFTHGNEGLVGGGMLADDFIVLPIVFAKWHRPPDVPTWGIEHKNWMRYAYPRFVSVMGPIQDIPNPEARVTVDPYVKDHLGVPVARLSGTTHPETVRVTDFMNQKGREWLEAAGAERIWNSAPSLRLSSGQHQAGTCRMGDDPGSSVVDATGKVHGFENIYVGDASVHVTNGCLNPVLTVMATARRMALLSLT